MRDAVGVGEADERAVPEGVDLGTGDTEPHVAGSLAGGGEVPEHRGLGVEPDRRADELLEVDPVPRASEGQVDAAVPVALGQHRVGHPGVDEQPDAVALEDAGTHRALDLGVRAVVDDDGVDPLQREQVGEHETGPVRRPRRRPRWW